MSFTSRSGSRGARQPKSGPVMRFINSMVSRRIRRGGKLMGGTDGLILTTVGAKTGQHRSTPVVHFPGPDDSWLIVASAAGARDNPAWYYNLKAHPEDVRIELAGRTVAVRAEQLHGTERERAWQQITRTSSRFAGYADKTDRELPVIRLTERSA
jgi:deazaflavin-dependent oxidoreductase (nitroreductase family)